MITITCDICGKPATIGLEPSVCGMYAYRKNLHMYLHHLCEDCATKIGIVEQLEELEKESKRALAQFEKEDNKEEQAK